MIMNIFSGKKQKRVPWTTEEKERARSYFHDEIYKNLDVSRQKANRFFHLHKVIYKHRTPHLIIQWVKGQQKKISDQQRGCKGNNLKVVSFE